MSEWSVYLIRCRDGTLYTGVSSDVARRFAEHVDQTGRGSRYLRGRGPLELVFQHAVGSRNDALRIEHSIKKLPREGKEALLSDRNAISTLVARAKRSESH